MAKITLGIATSHGPMLNTPPEEWGARAAADRIARLHYLGETYSFDELTARRGVAEFVPQLGVEIWSERHAACERALETLADTFSANKPEVAIVVSDDHMELFDDENSPALLIFTGESFGHVPFTKEQLAAMGPGLAEAEAKNVPASPSVRPGHRLLAEHLAQSTVAEGFDIAVSRELPHGKYRNRSIPHGFGFVYQRVMREQLVSSVPIFLNAFYPPNQPTAARCYDFGAALGRAVESWDVDSSIAVIASGGLSHFVVEEELDRYVLDALQTADAAALKDLSDARLQSGTAEIRNWLVLAGALSGTNLAVEVVDYVPCYRSEAGTGNAMGFVRWVERSTLTSSLQTSSNR